LGTSLGSLLIVDDEAAQLAALSNTLSQRGYAIVGVSSGEQALDILATQVFDLLLTDLKMPGMDGIALLRAALEIDSNLVGILMTGHGTIATAVEAMQVGALDYILKPFNLSAILPVLTRALAVRKLRLENAELERRVREHSAELEAANRELDAFAYSVSHDLRAPLRAVDGFSQVLREQFSLFLPPEGQRVLNQVAAGAKKMERLIEDMMRLSRLGRQPLTKRQLDSKALIGGIVEELRAEQSDRNVQVLVGDLPMVTADQGLFRQVFVNLLSNAFKFTRNRETPRIEVGCRQDEGVFVFFVRDNGTGFDMDYADRLFAVFQRLHSADEYEGTGVGLSIVQRIVQRHGGRIWAEAVVDEGATFHFTIAV
jgi:two-component system, sensor histidine kinase and response regulator